MKIKHLQISRYFYIKIAVKFFLSFTLQQVPWDRSYSILRELLWYRLDRLRQGVINDAFVPEGITIKSMNKILTYHRRQPRKR